VFSNPDVIRRVQADFVPVALKAGLVNNPPGDAEGRLYREIGRSKPAPQGICIINPAGKVLDWALMFDDDQSVLAFFDHALKRFARFPDAKKPVPAERYMRFPSHKLDDIEDTGTVLPVLDRHPDGKSCPAAPRLKNGTILARVFGRALDKNGKPVADTVRQEHYVEDRFYVPVALQERLAKAAADAGTRRFRLADRLARLVAGHAFLGQIDVNPVAAPGGKGDLKHCEFWVKKTEAEGNGLVQLRVEGKSEATGGSGDGDGADGRLWRHQVTLTWEGIVEMKEKRIHRLLLVARGTEKLKWGNQFQGLPAQADVTHLPGGHAIDLACGVRYGIIGEPLAGDQDGDDQPAEAVIEVPDQARRQLIQAFGGSYLVFHDKVQAELKLSDEQKDKVDEQLRQTIQKAMQFFAKVQDVQPREREKEFHAYRAKAQEKLAAFLEKALKADQRQRFRQIELQREGLFALVQQPRLQEELKITASQRKEIIGVIQRMQKTIQPVVEKTQRDGKPEEAGPMVMKIRKEHESKLETLLSAAQKKQWRELLGKPFALGE
jgi:hypothetical protein